MTPPGRRLRRAARSLFAALVTAACLLLFVSPPAASDPNAPTRKRIVFSTSFPEDMAQFDFYNKMYTEAFRRLDYDFKLVALPVMRSLVDADSGVTDGEIARIAAFKDNGAYPNLITVPEPIDTVKAEIYAPASNTESSFDSWESLAALRDSDVVIGHSRGFRAAELALRRYLNPKNIHTTASGEQSCRMLAGGRLDFIIEPDGVIDHLVAKGKCNGDAIRSIGVLGILPIFPVLNKRHADLAPKLARVIREMKDEGLLQSMRHNIFGESAAP